MLNHVCLQRSSLHVQAVVNGIQGQFQPVGHTELIEHIVQVVLHGLLRDEHFFGDFLVLIALGNQDYDLALALAQLGARS